MKQFIDFCKERVVEDVQSKIDTIMDINDVYVVWSCKTLRNKKCILSTDNIRGYIYEFTYNGNKNEVYMDIYKKESNKALSFNPID